jgi:cell wall-associated NlpC family hydrolase
MNRADLIAAARAAIGTPFVHQGRIVNVGLDCAGLLAHMCQSCGIPAIDQTGYPRTPSGGKLEAALEANVEAGVLRRVPVGEARGGDALVLRLGREPGHLGLMSDHNGRPTIIHAWQIVGKVVEHGLTDEWRKRVVRAYAFNGVSDE